MLWERSGGLPSFLEQLVVFLQSFVNNQLSSRALALAPGAPALGGGGGGGGIGTSSGASAFGPGLSLAVSVPPHATTGLGRRRSTLEEVQALAQAGLQFIANNLSISSIVTGGWRARVGGLMRQLRTACNLHPSLPRLPSRPCPPLPPCRRRPRGPAAPRGAADAQGGLGAGPHRVQPAAAGHAPAAPAAARTGGQPVRAGGGRLCAAGPAGARHLALLPGQPLPQPQPQPANNGGAAGRAGAGASRAEPRASPDSCPARQAPTCHVCCASRPTPPGAGQGRRVRAGAQGDAARLARRRCRSHGSVLCRWVGGWRVGGSMAEYVAVACDASKGGSGRACEAGVPWHGTTSARLSLAAACLPPQARSTCRPAPLRGTGRRAARMRRRRSGSAACVRWSGGSAPRPPRSTTARMQTRCRCCKRRRWVRAVQ